MSTIAADTVIRVGAVTCPAIVDAIDDNLAEINSWAEKAARANVQLLLFPELCVTGYATNGGLPRVLGPGDRAYQELTNIATVNKVTLAVGLVWQAEQGKKPFMAHGLWLPSGEVYLYFKSHLGMREQALCAAGNELPVFELPNVRVGIQMCLEQHFPDITQTLVLRGAQLVLCPHATPRLSPEDRRESWCISLRARAYDNCTYVMAANLVGDNGQGTLYPGGVLLINPAGQIIAEDFSGQSAMITAEIDLTKVVDVRTTPQGLCRRFYAPSRRPELYD